MLAAPAAQADEAAEAAAERSAARTLAPITVSANPLGLDLNSTTLPASVLEGDALIEQRNGTLGDTLKNLPGVNSDTFGGGASRPVIRGQTAPRVKVLSDGSEVMDASSISPDHAVTKCCAVRQRCCMAAARSAAWSMWWTRRSRRRCRKKA
jgi:iron complex outermembrane receptor protein